MSAARAPGGRERRQREDVPVVSGHLRIAIELAIGFAVLLAIDRLLGRADAFTGVQPHPYWLPVLLGAVLYGTGPGLAAAAVASLLWVLLGHHVFAPGQDYFVHVFAVAKLPLLWTISALGLGEIALFRARRLEKVMRREGKYARQVDILSRRYRRLNAINQDLQLRITTEQRTVPHAVAQAVAVGGDAVAPDALAALIALVTGSAAFTLYRAEDGQSSTVLTHGPVPAVRPGPVLLTAVRLRDTPVHVGVAQDQVLLNGIGLCAVAVHAGRQGPFFGALIFHDLPADRLTDAGIAGLGAVPQWLDIVVGRAGRA